MLANQKADYPSYMYEEFHIYSKHSNNSKVQLRKGIQGENISSEGEEKKLSSAWFSMCKL